MPLALLLSPDDQAVSAITGVLEEMSVTCERPLDGVSAAQLLNSQSFDLVLVDCENLPAAKLIFDVCRRGKNGNNPVPIAIVDGRAGLPTAFRLGAELILTKPVAKDQARTTIRTAVGRVKKDVPASVPEHAAAAAAASSEIANFAEPVSNFAASPAVSAASTTVTTKMNAAADVQDDEIAAPVHSKPMIPLTPSDDPVLAELERTELEQSEREAQKPQSQAADSRQPKSQKADSQNEISALVQAHFDDARSKSDAATVSPKVPRQQKTRSPLVAVLTLAIAGGGLYGAWMYEPEFRAIAQPQIDRVLALAGMTTPIHSPSSPKPVAQPVQAASAAPTPAPASTSDSANAQPTPSDSATDSATATPIVSTAPSADAAVPVQPSHSSGEAPAPLASGSAAAGAQPANKPTDTKQGAAKDAVGTSNLYSSSTSLLGENTAIILSSQGAQKRLVTSVPPKYPAAVRAEGGEGTVVLKAVIDETGKVDGLRLVEGNATLASAAMKAVKQWRYRPYMREGKPRPFQTIVIVDFQRQ
jgi:periplasmic protein TonB